MFISSWLTARSTTQPRRRNRLEVESLEDRDLPAPLVSISNATFYESFRQSKKTAPFQVTLSAPSTETVTVGFSTANGTAIAGQDYVATSGTLTFAPGETTKTLFVGIHHDEGKESTETFTVNLFGTVNADIGDGLGIGTINDDDNQGGLHGRCKWIC